MKRFSRKAAWLGLAASLLLTACGGPAPAPAPALVVADPTSGPEATQPATAQPVAGAEAATDAPIAQASEAAVPTAEAALYNGIPHGITAEGFYYLGEAAAPAALTDYSDFL